MYADINSEISEYKENVFYGLNLQQVIILIIALAIEIVSYFVFQRYLKINDLICTLIYVFIALPFGAAFVVKYNNMGFTKLVRVLFKYYFLQDKQLRFGNSNQWYKARKEKKGDIK